MTKKIQTLLIRLFALAFICFGLLIFYIFQQIHAPKIHDTYSFYILESGTSIRSVAKDLEKKGFISSALLFELNARFIDNDAPFQAGEYVLRKHTSIQNITEIFQSGKTYQHKLIIPEGLTKKQITHILQDDEALRGEIALLELPTEGYLLPQTYFFELKTQRQAMIDRMQ